MPSIFERLADTLTAAGRAWRGEWTRVEAPTQLSGATQTGATSSGDYASAGGVQEHFQPLLGEGLTPKAVAAAFANADRGYMQRLCDLGSEQRTKITHLATVLSTRETALSGCDFEVEPAKVVGKRAERLAKDAAEYVEMRFRAIPKLGDMRAWLAGGGVFYGRSAVELDLKRDREGVGVRGWLGIHSRRLSYAGPDNRLRLYDEGGNSAHPEFAEYPGVDLREKLPYKFLIHEPLTMGAEYPWRQGLVRPLIIMGMFWSWTTRDWYQFAELFGKPWRIGYYREGTQKPDIEALKFALAKLGGLSTAVLRDTSRVDVVSQKGNGSVHEALRAAQNAEISKIVLGQTATTEIGDVGAYSSTKVHKQVQQDKLNDDGRSVGETERHLAYWLVRFKWGKEFAAKYTPTIDILTAPDADLTEECKRAMMLVDHGVPMGVDALRDRYTTIPKPDEKEVVAHPARVQGEQDASVSDETADTAKKAEENAAESGKKKPASKDAADVVDDDGQDGTEE